MLTLAFDTATSVATSALVRDGELLGERSSRAVRVLADAEELLGHAGAEPGELTRVVVGTGPGSFTGVRMGLAAARGLAFALGLRLAGISTLDALAAGAPGALPVVDAGRREVFTLVDGMPAAVAPDSLRLGPGATCVGDGAVRYRDVLEALGARVPPRESELHVPRARFHVELAHEFVDPEAVEPLYLRLPDAEQAR
ncbi:MAG: tRNA (adenosine(37)-N6)-threonylcarbamoyltransferase complex dimerization subunit type 1 TsaB [Actinobacteria bacterium]|nr:MAG: tRNA (adenosine(37)-N6)-threonylcarbamoyltransferase complex dimerization subunit type 1 TsaB [Actinomycetota bacterium]